jgi:NarL family two-component system response regulator LiaR
MPKARILALTSFAADDKVFPAIKAGALGYMLKDSEPEDLIAAIKNIYRGEPFLHPSIARKVLEELSPQEILPHLNHSQNGNWRCCNWYRRA